jgi:hypothetical protein
MPTFIALRDSPPSRIAGSECNSGPLARQTALEREGFQFHDGIFSPEGLECSIIPIPAYLD